MTGFALYQQITEITEDYLGPASTRFVDRIARNHLHKPASQLQPEDMSEFVTWVQLAANVMSENAAAIEEYMQRLQHLVSRSEARRRTSEQEEKVADSPRH